MNFKNRCHAPWFLMLLCVLVLTGCRSQNPKNNPGARPKEVVPVAATQAFERDVPVEIKVVGHVEAYSTVTVKSRVNGELTKIYFVEG